MENLKEGLTLLALGMGFVLTFLCILIASMHIMSKIVGWLNKLFPEAVEEVKSAAKTISDDTAIALAIAAAKFRR